ncbi:hypothetical protein GOP47_0014953 [Adiantum capillus-veneris]|uniref:Cytochrome P450 n=1 Tax=Adiantum capillus-veneris TaxID=13818 RepID=A0A9D4UMQ0_ADICA|nr:hypothetical protein GOP47_0014953 [Adiantum capillus-veneris]
MKVASTMLLKMREIATWSKGFSEASWMLLACGCLSLMWARKWVRSKKERFPQGPLVLPIIGHMHLLMSLPHQALAKLGPKYGHLIGLKLGQQRCVVVSSPDLAKEFLVTHDKSFANRPPYGFTSVLLYGPENDLFFSGYGAPWRKHRKMCTLELFTAKRLQETEHVRQEEVGVLLQRISDLSRGGSAAIEVGECVAEMSTNLISRLLYSGPRVTSQKKDGENLPQLVKEMEQETAPFLGDFIPWLSWADVFRKRHMRKLHNRIDVVISGMLNERKQAMLQNSAPKGDFLHTLLSKEMAKSSQEDDVLTMNEIKSIMLGMLGGSIHTTSLTLEWAMAELLKNPHCLAKLQREIDTVLGKKDQITDADIPKLSYLSECKVRNYTIPANTHLLMNTWAIGRDEQVWKNAAQFLPERFESKDIDVKGLNFDLLPFGGGRRICLGLPLGLSIVEVTLANLVNKYNWKLPVGETSASLNMDEMAGITANRAIPMKAVPKLRL